MKRNSVGGRALAIATLLGLLAGPAEGVQRFPGKPHPAIHLTVAQDSESERLVCSVTETLPPSGKGSVVVGISVPHESKLKSALLKTGAGQLALDLATTTAWAGLYTFVITSDKVDCAVSGALVLVVEGELDESTVGCPEIPLFKAGACDESTSAKR
jgi:hypothetical protein